MPDNPWRLFDKTGDVKQSLRTHPHWDQKSLTFVTFRLADSMPLQVVELWKHEQLEWLRAKGLPPSVTIEEALQRDAIPEKLRRQFLKMRTQRWHENLDACHGSCLLKDPQFSEVVADSLLYFNGQRYDLERFVVMPNHVHALVQMRAETDLRKQCTSWMRFSARKINAMLQRQGEFWQPEPFDHVVRNERQFEYLQTYIVNNPKRANLEEQEYCLWVSK